MIWAGLWIGLYQLLTRIFGLVAHPYLLWRGSRGKESRSRLNERLGFASQKRPQGSLAWLHGASVGESLSLIPLIERMQSAGFNVLLTTGTVTSANLAAKRMPAGTIHQFLPLDVPRFVKRFLDHWQPDIVIFAESELWPNFISTLHQRDLPLILVNARLSPRSFVRWQKAPSLIAHLLSGIDMVLAQTANDAARLMQLGATRVVVTGNLKFDSPAPPVHAEDLAYLTGLIGTRPLWVAASTHPGEEEILLDVHQALSLRFTNLLTIIVPRHPQRGADILKHVDAHKLRGALRSAGGQPIRDVQIYIADTMGELGLFYRLAGLIFMGGSLVSRGGQNPIEPAKLGSAIVYGSHVHNFAEVYQILAEARGAVQVKDKEQLAEVLTGLLSDSGKFRMMARAAFDAVEQRAGATRNVMRAIEPYIVQMQFDRKRAD
jgi:3-deoxy-D-manno-octulosonic-acid transferase